MSCQNMPKLLTCLNYRGSCHGALAHSCSHKVLGSSLSADLLFMYSGCLLLDKLDAKSNSALQLPEVLCMFTYTGLTTYTR